MLKKSKIGLSFLDDVVSMSKFLIGVSFFSTVLVSLSLGLALGGSPKLGLGLELYTKVGVFIAVLFINSFIVITNVGNIIKNKELEIMRAEITALDRLLKDKIEQERLKRLKALKRQEGGQDNE